MSSKAKGSNSGPGWAKRPGYSIRFEPSPRRVRATFGGATVAESSDMRLLYESNHLPVYYFPRTDVCMNLLEPTDHSTNCPFKGNATYYSIRARADVSENAVWSYEAPYDEMTEIKDYISFYWDRVDHWYEEDEEIFVHPRDPYHRVDVVRSSRPVKVIVGGETVVESTRALFLYETNLPTRYYIPESDVRMDLFVPTATRTRCPYKGEATYWSARIGGKDFEDIVWSYLEPIPECPRIKGYLCFYNEVVDDILVDGTPVPKVRTKWSRD